MFNNVKDFSKSDWRRYLQTNILHKSLKQILQSVKNSTKLKKLLQKQSPEVFLEICKNSQENTIARVSSSTLGLSVRL